MSNVSARGKASVRGNVSARGGPRKGRGGDARFAGGVRYKKRKGPSRIYLKGPVNPAATYSPGPGGQVPSAI